MGFLGPTSYFCRHLHSPDRSLQKKDALPGERSESGDENVPKEVGERSRRGRVPTENYSQYSYNTDVGTYLMFLPVNRRIFRAIESI